MIEPNRTWPRRAGTLLLRRTILALLGMAAFVQVAAAETVRVTFLHVNDVYQHAPRDGRGGLAELATLLEAERTAATGPVFFTFGGDLISPSLASAVTKGEHMIAFFNRLGTDVAVLGNHEFDFGPEVAVQRIAESRFPWLGTNVLGPDGHPFGGTVATVLREAQGLRIGFVGVLTPGTAQLARTEGISFTPPAEALRVGAAALRQQGADLVIALTHLDLAEDRRIAREVPGIDLVLGGHDHDPASLSDGGALVAKAGSDAHWLAVVELVVERPAPGEPRRPARVRSVGWRFVPNVGVAPSPRLAAMVASVEETLDQALGRPLARLEGPLDSRTVTVRREEAALGNLIADALRAHFAADAALINGGGLRGNREYPPGHAFTRRDLLTELPFNNAATLLEVTGAELLRALENGLSAVERGAGRFPQVSRLTVDYDPSAPAGRRVTKVRVGGQPLDPGRRYRLATSDYLAGGGDGYAMLKAARVLVDASGGPLVVNLVAEAIAGKGVIDARVEGRIRPARP